MLIIGSDSIGGDSKTLMVVQVASMEKECWGDSVLYDVC